MREKQKNMFIDQKRCLMCGIEFEVYLFIHQMNKSLDLFYENKSYGIFTIGQCTWLHTLRSVQGCLPNSFFSVRAIKPNYHQ